MKDQLMQLFLQYAVPLILTGVGTGLTWLVTTVAKNYAAQGAHTLVQTVLYKVESLALMVVTDVEQTMRPLVEAAAADGKITPEEGAALKNAAIGKLKRYIGLDGLSKLAKVLSGGSVEEFLGTAIEHAVSKLPSSIAPTVQDVVKAAASAAGGPPVDPVVSSVPNPQ